MKKIIKEITKKFIPVDFLYNNISEIKSAVSGCYSFLDLGCGSNSPYLKYLYNKNNYIVSDYPGDWIVIKLPSPIIL